MSKRTRLKQPNPSKFEAASSRIDPLRGMTAAGNDGQNYTRTRDGSIRRVGHVVREKDRKAVEDMARQIAAKTPPTDDEGSGPNGIQKGGPVEATA